MTRWTPRAGVTLIEMMIVVALIALIAAVTFPAVSAGVDTLRLNQAAGGLVSFFNASARSCLCASSRSGKRRTRGCM